MLRTVMPHAAPARNVELKAERSAQLSPSARRKAGRLVPSLIAWFAREARDLPWRRTRDPYAIWVSEIMLQQTQVRTVIPYYERWLATLPDVHALACATTTRLHKLWEGLGYYTRVQNLQAAARKICYEHQGRFPTRFEEVIALPGIGRYTAGAICSIAFNQPTPILDGNVIRVLTRLFGIERDPKSPETNRQLWGLAELLVHRAAAGDRTGPTPSGDRRSAKPTHGSKPGDARSACGNWLSCPPCSALNQALMELGAILCTPRNPRCDACPLARSCVARRKNRVNQTPATGQRRPPVKQLVRAFMVRSGDRFLAIQRPKNGVNAGLWEFPSAEVVGSAVSARRSASMAVGLAVSEPRLLGTIRHSITHHRITLEAYGCEVQSRTRTKGARRWFTAKECARMPFSAAHRKLAGRYIPHFAVSPVPSPLEQDRGVRNTIPQPAQRSAARRRG